MKKYILGVYEKAMPFELSFREKLETAKRCGFDTLEISIDETDERLCRLDWTREERLELKALCDEIGVGIKTMCLSGHRKYPFGSHDSETRARSLEIMEKAIVFAYDVGISIIQLAGYDVYYEEGDSETRKYFAENLKKAAEMAAAYGICLGFETMETPFMDTVTKAMEYVETVNSPYLGVYPDIGNLKNASVVYGSELVADIACGRGHIFACHIKETRPGIYRNLNFGEGHTEYIPCLKELWAQGVRRYTGEFWYLGEGDYEKTMADSAKFLREKIEAVM